MPGLVKIGLTSRNPKLRADELTRATGVPSAFVIAWCRAVSDCPYVEAAVHRMLLDKRVSDRREFFRCDVATARQVIEAAAGSMLGRSLPVGKGRRSPRRRRKRLWRGDGSALMILAGVALLLALLLFKPQLPGWVPRPLASIVQQIGPEPWPN